MSRFTLRSHSAEAVPLEFHALDPSVVLDVAGRNGFSSGDLLREGVYLCTIRRAGEAAGGGYWIVSRKQSAGKAMLGA
jgi:hypothetical protein